MLRAVDHEDKQFRRTTILKAARQLFASNDGSLPTVENVAEAAGLAKGTVYLYFRTKEEIFANVLLEGWLPLFVSTSTIFKSPSRTVEQRTQAFLRATIRHIKAEPDLLRLDSLAAGVLEKNMTPNALEEYKRRFHTGLLAAGSEIETALALPAGRGTQLLMRTYALTRGLWQLSAGSQDSASRKGVEETTSCVGSAFLTELADALGEYWRGALSANQKRL